MKKIIPIMFIALAFILVGCGLNVKLPDLNGETEANAIVLLKDITITAEVEYVQDENVETGYFVAYKDYAIGDKVDTDSTVTIQIAQNGVILPDLSGKTEAEAITTLDALGLSYNINYEVNYDLPDYNFNRYDIYEAGDRISVDETLNVYMVWSGSYLPDISSMYKTEAIEALEYDFIKNYDFEYVIDDNQTEDIVAGYKDFEAGDPAIEDGTITVLLYKNSFNDVATSIFFSKYLEGTGNSRALEIYNPTNDTVDLSLFHIVILQNGSYEISATISLDGMLESGETYTIAYSGSSQDLLDFADATSNRLVFDGNDTIQLRYSNETYLDTIYDLGEQLFLMTNELFVRDENTVKGTRDFVLSDWDGYVPDYYEIFGDFPFSKPESFTISEEYLYNQIGLTTVSGMEQVTLDHTTDGDTAAFTPGYINDARVRFLGTDTPETNQPYDWNTAEDGVWEAEPWGLEAKAYTSNILSNATVIYLQSDPDLGFKETYGRTLAYVWADGVMVNYELVKLGFSHNYLSTDSQIVFEHRYLYRWFQDAEAYAIENELGIHS